MTRLFDLAYHQWLALSVANRIRKRSAPRRYVCTDYPSRPHRLGVLAIMKNESHLIEEWIEHNLWIGADRIFLIDNGSTDDTIARLKPWLDRGQVELVVYPEQHRQVQHYWTAINEFRLAERCEWLLNCDIDEFFFCKSGESLADFVTRQTRFDVIYVNGAIFGTSGHASQPASVRAELTMRTPRLSRFTKCIFRPSVPTKASDLDVHFIWNTPRGRSLIANRDLQFNHYVTQSRHYWFDVKMQRGDVRYSKVNLDAWAKRYQLIEATSTERSTRLRDLLAQAQAADVKAD